jgi:hypothetical protein
LKYLFLLYADGGRSFKLDGAGLRAGATVPTTSARALPSPTPYPTDPMPEWARGGVGYQIFPDRFRREGEAEKGWSRGTAIACRASTASAAT